MIHYTTDLERQQAAEIERLGICIAEWLKANSPGGWIDDYRKDAERYRWLRGQASQNTSHDRYGNGGHWAIGFFSEDNHRSLDAAIDAAMKEQP